MIELGLLQKQLAIYNAQYEERTRYGCSLLKANFAHLLDFQNPRGPFDIQDLYFVFDMCFNFLFFSRRVLCLGDIEERHGG